jgi:hypothetical protein
MRIYAAFFLLIFLCPTGSSAQFWHRTQKKWPQTEGELIYKLLHCLQTRDTAAYYDLFPPFDTLWSMTMRNHDENPQVQKELAHLKAHPQVLIEFDPLYNKEIIGNFCRILSKGEDSGIMWGSTVMARYELHKQEPTRATEGIDRIALERFSGYMFVTDAFNRTIYCITVAEVQKIKGQFFGGQLVNVLQAKTAEEFRRKEDAEQAYFVWKATHPDTVVVEKAVDDSLAANDTSEVSDPLSLSRDDEPEEDGFRRQVVERRYYEGFMDSVIPVSLYIRYMKSYPGKPDQYDGLYKLGKDKKYLKLEIKRRKSGKWIIEDETAVGTMELTLTGRKYVGFWINSDDNGFDVAMTQTGTPKGLIELLDQILDRGLSGYIDEEQLAKDEAKREKEEKKKKEKEEKAEKEKKEKEAKAEKKRLKREARKKKKAPDKEE